jgi:hypothetical protein
MGMPSLPTLSSVSSQNAPTSCGDSLLVWTSDRFQPSTTLAAFYVCVCRLPSRGVFARGVSLAVNGVADLDENGEWVVAESVDGSTISNCLSQPLLAPSDKTSTRRPSAQVRFRWSDQPTLHSRCHEARAAIGPNPPSTTARTALAPKGSSRR